MPNPLEDAFEQMLDSQERANGSRKTVSFRSETIDALIGQEGNDEAPAFGGTANEAHIRINLRKSDVELPIEVGEKVEITGSGIERDVISYIVLEGSITVMIGDLEEEET